MKKNNYILFTVNSIVIVGIIILLPIMKFNTEDNNTIKNISNISTDDSLLIMYTDKNYISSYVLFNLSDKTELKVFERKNECFSDFAIDKTGTSLYYSNLVNNKYNIFRVDLNSYNETNIFDENYYGGDIFELYDETLIFRTVSNDRRSYVIGEYSLINNEMKKLDNFNNDFDMFNFYIDKNKRVIYTIEYLLSEADNITSPEVPIYNIFKYDMNKEQKELIYSTNKIISLISVNIDENKILFEAENMENDIATKKIYLLDLNHKTEKVILENNLKFNNISFENISKPKFSTDGEGFYFLATTDESVIIEEVPGVIPIKSKAIYYYNLTSNDIELIYDNKNEVINGYKIN